MKKTNTIELNKNQAKLVAMRGRCSGYFDTRSHQSFETYSGIAMGTVIAGVLAYWLQMNPPIFLLGGVFVFSVIAALVTAARFVSRRSVVLIEMNETEEINIDLDRGEVTWTVRRKNQPEKQIVVCKDGFKLARITGNELYSPYVSFFSRKYMRRTMGQEGGADSGTRKYYILTGTPEKAAAKLVEGLQGEHAETIRSLNQCELHFWVDEKESPAEAAILEAL